MMRKSIVLLTSLLFVFLTACGVEGKLNKDGGYIQHEEDSLTVFDFDVKKGEGSVTVTEYDIFESYDEVTLSESEEKYDVTVEKDDILIHVFFPVTAKLSGKELHISGFFGESDEVLNHASAKEIANIIEELNEKVDEEQKELTARLEQEEKERIEREEREEAERLLQAKKNELENEFNNVSNLFENLLDRQQTYENSQTDLETSIADYDRAKKNLDDVFEEKLSSASCWSIGSNMTKEFYCDAKEAAESGISTAATIRTNLDDLEAQVTTVEEAIELYEAAAKDAELEVNSSVTSMQETIATLKEDIDFAEEYSDTITTTQDLEKKIKDLEEKYVE